MSPKKCVFGCEGKLALYSFPKKPALREQWARFVSQGHDGRCAAVFVCYRHFGDDCFTNKAQFDAGFADRLKLKDGSVPAIRDPRHEAQAIMDRSCLLTVGISPGTKKRIRTPEGTRAEKETQRSKTRIDIGRAFPLWRKVGEQMGFKSDPEMAFFLLQRVCGENVSVQRKRGRKKKSTPVPALQTEGSCQESEVESIHPSDEDMEASEICYEVSPSHQTDESSQNRLKSEYQLKTEHQLMSEDQIKSEDHLDKDICKVSVAPTENEAIVQQSSTFGTTTVVYKEIKEEPVETELESRLEVSTGPVATSEKMVYGFVPMPNPVTVEAAGKRKRPLAAHKKHFSGLFQTCLQCGGPVLEYTTVSSGNQNRLQWKCSQGHLMWLFPNTNP